MLWPSHFLWQSRMLQYGLGVSKMNTIFLFQTYFWISSSLFPLKNTKIASLLCSFCFSKYGRTMHSLDSWNVYALVLVIKSSNFHAAVFLIWNQQQNHPAGNIRFTNRWKNRNISKMMYIKKSLPDSNLYWLFP